MRKVECGNDYSTMLTFTINNGRNGLAFRLDGEKVLIDLDMAPGPLFSSAFIDAMRTDLERNGMDERDLDNMLDMIAEKVYSTVIGKRISENIRRG